MKTSLPFFPLLALFCLLPGNLPAQAHLPASSTAGAAAPVLAWGRQWGTPADDFGSALAVDPAGRCFIAGHTTGDLAAPNAGKKDAFVAAFDADGQRLWAVQLGSAEDDAATAVALAPDGSLYVGGTTGGQLGAAQLGGRDVFLAQLDSTGRILWREQFGSAADDDCGAITCDASGAVFLTGATAGRIGAPHRGGMDAFLLKVVSAGTLAWTCQWGTDGADVSRGLTADADGNLYATGSTTGGLDGAANAGATDIFASKIDPTGKLVWSRQFGTPAPEQGMNIRVDATHNLYVAGSSAGELAAPALGGGDSVLLKLSPAGGLLWKKQFGTARWDGIHGITLASDGTERVIVGGCQNWDQCQGFLREFDPAGAELWSAVIPSTQLICGTQIAVDEAGNLYQTGGTHGPAFGDYHGSGNDIILVKLTPRPSPAEVRGAYFGQSPPSRTPQIFAPDILSRPDRMEALLAFSPDGQECFFTVPQDFHFSRVKLYGTRRVDDAWTSPTEAPFSPPAGYCGQPFFSSDGTRLYFTSNANGSYDTWSVARTAQGWGGPEVLPAPFNSPSADGPYSQSIDGTAYLASDRPGSQGRGDVWRISPPRPGQSRTAENLGPMINSNLNEGDPFISPDGQFLIYTSDRPGGAGGLDLYVALANGKGGWSTPVNLNDYCPGINTDAFEYGPSLSPDGRYLFFVRLNPRARQCDVWWVENPVAESARKKPPAPSAPATSGTG